MKHKILLSVAAAATFTFTSLGAIHTEAATMNSDCHKVQNIKVCGGVIGTYYWQNCQPGNLDTNLPTVEVPGTDHHQPEVEVPETENNVSGENTPVVEDTEQNDDSTVSDYEVSAFEQKVLELTNAERAKQGLSPLTLDTELSKVARIKSQDMKDNNYFSHTSPTYGSPFDMMQKYGISYSYAAENIAQGQTTPEEVVKAWMNSQGHRENIMNANYTHIGIGYVADGNYWTQMFIGK